MSQNQEKFSYEKLADSLRKGAAGVDATGLSKAAGACVAARLHRKLNIPLVVVTASAKEGERFVDDFCFFSNRSAQSIFYFPPYNIMPFKRVSYHNETAAGRIRTLYNLIDSSQPSILVTSVDAVLQKLIPRSELCRFAELIQKDEEINRDLLIKKLTSGGYINTAIVEEPGDFSIRGGIVDIFSTTYADPLRIEMVGDTVEALRFFSTTTQRTIRHIHEAVILPAKEVILTPDSLPEIISRIREQAASLEMPVTRVREYIRCIKDEGVFSGVESLIPLIYTLPGTFFDYIPKEALYILSDPGELERAAETFAAQADKNFKTACEAGKLCLRPEASYMDWQTAMEAINRSAVCSFHPLPIQKETTAPERRPLQIHFSVSDNTALSAALNITNKKENLLLPLARRIGDLEKAGNLVLLVCRTESQAHRLKALLIPYGIHPGFMENFPTPVKPKGAVYICPGALSAGLIWPEEGLAVITEAEIFGARAHKRKIQRKEVIDKLLGVEDLKSGDFVVHIEHGIGHYRGLAKLNLNGSENDFLLIEYRDNDKLYLPVDRLGLVQKYLGMNDAEPLLDKLGGTSWDRVKKKIKKSVEKIAGELLQIYAQRTVSKGYSYEAPDGYYQDFEAAFPYDETADQIKAIQQVMDDLARPIPMDRLVCGDVGYGKTEVALRAAFVAVNAGKQVAVLVPTTVLAEQHYTTFSSRFKRYPVQIASLSRFRSLKEQRTIIDDLKAGRTDIVIGTHRLLQKDVLFKDLGLIVLDEEQRFGVRHKEQLKKIRSTVDVLALSATPIPRTLHMSLMGIRDISLISTPPEHRHAIITYICELDDAIIAEAIRKELNRNGQLFFVHNNIHSIQAMAAHLQRLVPDVRLGVAHGRMDEGALEKVMLKFAAREIDMLVCTTIIESGLDIPSANTILVNRADRFGLSQMYQLRGRVGRAEEQAYAYLFIPSESLMGKDAQKRLKVLMEHSDLGSGFQIAMNDLKIRGGGTILGASQSGHVAAVGYDMYLKLMENAIAELKGEPVLPDLDPEINIAMSAFITEGYMPDIDQRLLAYRQLAKMTELSEIADFKSGLLDRYGAIPAEVSNLLLKIMLRVLCIKAGIKKLELGDHRLAVQFSEPHQKNPAGIINMVVANGKRFQLTPDGTLIIRLNKSSTGGLWGEAKNILKEIIQHGNG
ncbi:MAG: transcription-repair coupling factor [Desulfobacterales bacterium]|nr:transcription-repair coupling factor [Desulfobacterales bacterium]